MPQRVQMRRDRPWRVDHPDAVIVDRSTDWGNPFRVGDPNYQTAEEATRRFRASLTMPPRPHPESYMGKILARLGELRGKDLACWCPLDQPCHADVLLDLANAQETPHDR